MKCKKIHGNVLSQVNHDGVILVNHKNFHFLTIQCIDTFWEYNLVVCYGFSYPKNNKYSVIAEIFNKKIKYIN